MFPDLLAVIAKAKSKKHEDTEDILPKIYQILIYEYGFIPYDDYLKIPIPVVYYLLDCIAERHEKTPKNGGVDFDRLMRRRKR